MVSNRVKLLGVLLILNVMIPLWLFFVLSTQAMALPLAPEKHTGAAPVHSLSWSPPLASAWLQTGTVTTTERLIWGQVFNHETGAVVTGAVVWLQSASGSVSVTTATPPAETEPIYAFSSGTLTAVEAAAGDVVTLTASYGPHWRQHAVIVPTESRYLSFSVGWRCDASESFPDEEPIDGFPDEEPIDGFPDMACFWGYGRLNGEPMAGIQIHLEVSDTLYTAQTYLHPDDPLPYYSIAVWGGQQLDSSAITMTATYSDLITTQVITASFDAALSQRVDVELAGSQVLNVYSNGDVIQDLAWHDGAVWAATTGGVVRWQPQDATYQQWTTTDGLATNYVNALTVSPDETLWFATRSDVSHYLPGSPPDWESFHTLLGHHLINARKIVSADDGSLWLTIGSGVHHYIPGSPPLLEKLTTADGLAHKTVHDLALADDGSVWIGTEGGVSHYIPGEPPIWETYTTSVGLVHDKVKAIAVAPDDSVWLGTPIGVSHFISGPTPTWETFTNTGTLVNYGVTEMATAPDNSVWFGTAVGLSHYTPGPTPTWEAHTQLGSLSDPFVTALLIASDGSPWVGTGSGLYHLDAGSPPTWQLFTTDSQLLHNDVRAITTSPGGTTWFALANGVGRYTPGGTPEWQQYDQGDGLAHNNVLDVAMAEDGSVWFGTKEGASHLIPGPSPVWQTFKKADGLPSNWINAIHPAADGSVWFATFVGVSHYTPGGTPAWENFSVADGLNHDFVLDITEAADGTLWAATKEGVNWYVPGQSASWHSYTTADGLADNLVRVIKVAPDGSVWFGTNDGVSHFTPGTSPSWETFNIEDGLVNRRVYAVEMGIDGSIWFGTAGGVSHYTPYKNTWENVTTADGLSGDLVQAVAFSVSDSLWFGTDSGVTQWVAPQQRSDLAVAVGGGQTAVAAQPYPITLSLTNHGSLPALGTVLSLTLPLNTTFVTATLAPTTTTPLQWSLDTLFPGETRTITAVLQPDNTWQPSQALVVAAQGRTASPEITGRNNTAWLTADIIDLTHADVTVSLVGPPLLIPGSQARYRVMVANNGGLTADAVQLNLTLSPGLQYISATLTPTAALQWTWPDVWGQTAAAPVEVTLAVSATIPLDTDLMVTAVLTSPSPDYHLPNNQVTAVTPASLADTQTLILVAPDRLQEQYGPSTVMNHLYTLAQHPLVNGAILNVTSDSGVAAAYGAWDANPADAQAANLVAARIKALINTYTDAYPSLQYLVIVGHDEIIPFYRVADQNSTQWAEHRYHTYVPPNASVRSALAQDQLLTDDYYTALTVTVPNSPFWEDAHSFYLPTLASGRLVETPDDIITTIDAFTADNGQIALSTGVVSADPRLADDLQQAMCQFLPANGITVTHCSSNSHALRSAFLQPGQERSVWTAVHSNHFNMGTLSAVDVAAQAQSAAPLLTMSIGCHAGLPVTDHNQIITTLDLPQAFLGSGGAYIAATSYTFGSMSGIAYSEALLQTFAQQLLLPGNQTVGQSLVMAKQAYFDERAQWIDYTDEKVLLPIIFYGLPMQQVVLPAN